MFQNVKTIVISSDHFMAESRRAKTILSVLLSLLGKSRLLLAIFINRYREEEKTVKSIIVHRSPKVVVFCVLNFWNISGD